MFDTNSRSGLRRELYSSQCDPRFWQILYWSYPIAYTGSDSESDTNFMNPLANLPLYKVITQLTPQELAFFSMIDAQLDKVESFYLAKEKEMVARSCVLLNQLEDLKDHREMFVCHFLFSLVWVINNSMVDIRKPIPKKGRPQARAWVPESCLAERHPRSLRTRKDKFLRRYCVLFRLDLKRPTTETCNIYRPFWEIDAAP